MVRLLAHGVDASEGRVVVVSGIVFDSAVAQGVWPDTDAVVVLVCRGHSVAERDRGSATAVGVVRVALPGTDV